MDLGRVIWPRELDNGDFRWSAYQRQEEWDQWDPNGIINDQIMGNV